MKNYRYDPLKAENNRLKVLKWLFVNESELPILITAKQLAIECRIPSHSVVKIFKHKDVSFGYEFEKISKYMWKISIKNVKTVEK